MKLSNAIVGVETGPVEEAIDARCLMAYGAGLGETDTRYYDTAAGGALLEYLEGKTLPAVAVLEERA